MRVMNRASVDKQDLRHMEERELSELGVRLVHAEDLVLAVQRMRRDLDPAPGFQRQTAIRLLAVSGEMQRVDYFAILPAWDSRTAGCGAVSLRIVSDSTQFRWLGWIAAGSIAL